MAASGGDRDDDTGNGLGVATRTRTRTKQPTPYRVQATQVMLHVHQKGVGVCGVFSYEVAETKVGQVMDFARQNQHPLQCTMEKA